jgi:hypothetical protein
MAFESTAINDLVAGLQQKPLARESDDWLFGEGDDATQIDPRAGQLAAEFDPMRAVELPRPFAQMPVPMPIGLPRHSSSTAHVRSFDWLAAAKKLVVPVMVISIVSVAFGIYFAVTDDTPSTNAVAAVVDEQPSPVVTSIEMPVETSVELPATKAVEAAEPAAASSSAPPVVERVEMTAVVTPVEAPAPSEPAVVEKVEVPPGSPAGRFLAPPPVETTIKTIEKPSPAPTTVADLAPASWAPSLQNAAPAAKVASAPRVTPAAKSAKPTTPAKRAAKPVARTNVRASKARTAQPRTTKKAVAAAPEPEPEAAPARTGKGILSISSTPAMEVWVDGRNSNALTPVRIKLLAGRHKVTLRDKQNAKARSFEIEIKPDETTTVTKNYQ